MKQPQDISAHPVRHAFLQSLHRSKTLVMFMLKIVLPLYVLTEIMLQSGALKYIGGFMQPVMAIWNLPPEASVVIASGLLINLYAAVAVAAPLAMTWQQVTVLGLMLGIAHALPMESAVVREITPGWQRLNLLRLGGGLGAGWLLSLVLA